MCAPNYEAPPTWCPEAHHRLAAQIREMEPTTNRMIDFLRYQLTCPNWLNQTVKGQFKPPENSSKQWSVQTIKRNSEIRITNMQGTTIKLIQTDLIASQSNNRHSQWSETENSVKKNSFVQFIKTVNYAEDSSRLQKQTKIDNKIRGICCCILGCASQTVYAN